MTEQANKVRIALIRNCLTYDWLRLQFEKIGVKLARTELSDILHGRRTSKKALMVLDKSAEFLERYETFYQGAGEKCT